MRFSCNDYDPSKPDNVFSHLTNYGISCKFRRSQSNGEILDKIPGNMWSLDQLRDYLDSSKFIQSNAEATKINSECRNIDLWTSQFLPQIKEIIVNTMLAGWGSIDWRPGGVGIYGFDVMSDTNLKLWLIEVNKTPQMDYTTDITREMVPRFMEELVTLLIRDKHCEGAPPEKDSGNFELLFS